MLGAISRAMIVMATKVVSASLSPSGTTIEVPLDLDSYDSILLGSDPGMTVLAIERASELRPNASIWYAETAISTSGPSLDTTNLAIESQHRSSMLIPAQ